MFIMKKQYAILLLLTLLYFSGCQEVFVDNCDDLTVNSLRCENRNNPLGIDIANPRLSWILESDVRGQCQTAYQVYVASELQTLDSGQPDIWDSGMVNSDETVSVVYSGKPLKSSREYYWKVRVWDKHGKPSSWSKPAKWSMGLLGENDWQAEWVGFDVREEHISAPEIIKKAYWIWSDSKANISSPPSTLYFRKEFLLPTDRIIKKAIILYNADDFVSLFVNESKLRSFRKRRVVNEVSMIDLLNPGQNVLAFQVANEGDSDSPAGLIAAVRIEFENGETLEFATDDKWLLSGEEHKNWKSDECDDSRWLYASKIGLVGVSPWEDIKPIEKLLPPARYFRKAFNVTDKPIKRATVYATSLGIYQLYLNGSRISHDYLSPGWTDYRKRVIYRSYDVTGLLVSPDNAVGLVLADGWYAGYVGGGYRRNHYGHRVRAIVQLNIEYTDGTSQVIATGPDWKAALGPVVTADLLQGETYDARNEMPGWNTPGFDDSSWASVVVGDTEVTPMLCAAVTEGVIAVETLKPLSITEPIPGRYVFDMGQNFAGVVRLKVKGKNGHRIQIRHGEWLNPNGSIYTANLRTAAATDVYICSGSEIDTIWQPDFTYHGFQYVEVSGLCEEPDLDTLIGVVYSSDTPRAGHFDCSDDMVNQLYSNIFWTQRMNFIDIPTDCPQRDERYGWTGDAQVYINTACYNNDVQSFFNKWLIDLSDAQRADGQYPRYAPLKVKPTDGGPAWADAGVICPWTIYEMYGDKRVLEIHYDAMKQFVEFNRKRCSDALLPPDKFHCFGDWLNINDDTPNDVIYMAYFGHSVNLLAKIADVLGNNQDALEYHDLFDKIKLVFINTYIQQDGRIKGDSQAGYVLAIVYDLLDQQRQKLAGEHLVRRIRECGGHLSTGFIGTKDLMLALAKISRNDIAYQLLYNDTYPSWGFSIKNGATSIWERWYGWTPEDGFADPDMNSFAHYSFGAVGQWIFENIGGISTDGPGFKNIVIHPQPDSRLTWAKTAFHSVSGYIESDWKINDGRFILNVKIPANTQATVYIPTCEPDKVKESGIKADNAYGVSFIGHVDSSIVYKVQAGQYTFVSPWVPN